MKKKKKMSLRFSKKENWLVFSGSLSPVLNLANSLEKPLHSFDFEYLNDLGLIRLGKKRGARQTALFFKTEPIVGLLSLDIKGEEKSLSVLLKTLDNLHRLAARSRAGKTISPTLFKVLEKLARKNDFKNVRMLESFCKKLRRCSADDLWSLAIFAGFPEDMLDFAKFTEKKEGIKKVNLKRNIRSWYKETDAGRERTFIEQGLENNWL